MTYLFTGLSAVLALVFTVSASSKFRGGGQGRRDFVATLRRFGLAPRHLVRAVAASLTLAEIVTAAGLWWSIAAGLWQWLGWRPAALAAAVLAAVVLVVLSIGVYVAIRRGAREPCSCFGTGHRPLGRSHLARNLCLLAAAVTDVAAIVLMSADPVESVGAVVALAAAGVVGLITIRLDDLVDLFVPTEPSDPAAA